MKNALLFLMVLLGLLASCKKDDGGKKDETIIPEADLVVKTKLAGESALKAGVYVKVYYGTTTSGQAIYEGITNSEGLVTVNDLKGGLHTISAEIRNATAVDGNENLYVAIATFQFELGDNHVEDIELACTNCCDCVNGRLAQGNTTCSCMCYAGYSGTSCTTVIRDQLVGPYWVSQYCDNSFVKSFSMTVSAVPDSVDYVAFNRFGDYTVHGQPITIKAQISITQRFVVQPAVYDSMSIRYSNLFDSDFTSNSINLYYQHNTNTTSSECYLEMSKL